MSKYQNEQEKLEQTNQKLIKELKEQGIGTLQLSSIGNSISTGFSIMSANIPLLKRNITLKHIAKNNGIDLKTHQFSRSENNNDEHLFEWLLQNKTEEEFNALSRRDYYISLKKANPLLNEEEIKTYYPIEEESNKGIKDVLFEHKNALANIAITNVGTGAFLDNWTRLGKHKLTGGIAKDRSYIEALLGMIQLNNRESYANTQIYLCGAPRIINTPLTDIFINRYLKDISQRYANVTYVPNFSRKAFYFNKNMLIPLPDPHYNEEEYLHLLNEVEEFIIKNYQIKNHIIEIDRKLATRSKELELSEQKIDTKDEILTIIEYHADLVESSGKDRNVFLKTTQNYLLERYPYDYFSLDHKAIKESNKLLAKKEITI